ncbi:MAG: ATP-binding protein [Bacillota bacterium]
MKHEKMRLVKMLDEILFFSLMHNSTEIDINIKIDKEKYIIQFEDNSRGISEEIIEKMRELINVEKQPEMEEYYWELTGQQEYSNEFTLVGLMSDKVDVDYDPEKGLSLTLYRNLN